MPDYTTPNGRRMMTVQRFFEQVANPTIGNNAPLPVSLSFLEWIAATDEAIEDAYRMYRDYYDGAHDTQITDRLKEFLQLDNDTEFNLNYMPIVVETIAERLAVKGFDVQGEDETTPDTIRQGGKDGRFWQWWNDNKMDATQHDVHLSAGIDGDTFVIVEWDNDKGIPKYSHELAYDGAYGVTVRYREDKRSEIKFAVKRWRVESGPGAGTMARMNVYTPDAIFKYVTSGMGWKEYYDDENNPVWPIAWVDKAGKPLGIPVVHFRNNSAGGDFGKSELKDVIPPQNALNKTAVDLLASADVAGFGMPTLTGDQPPPDMIIAPGQIMYTKKADARWGQIGPFDMSGLLALVERFVMIIAQISRVPLNYFQITGQVASDATQRANDTGLVAKVEQRAVGFGNAWESVMEISRRLHNTFGDGPELPELAISTAWASFERVDRMDTETRRAAIVTALVQAGATIEGAAHVAGYTEEEIQLLVRGDMVDGVDQ